MKIIFLNTWHGKLRDELRSYVERHLLTTDVFCFVEATESDREPYEDLLGGYERHYAQRLHGTNGSWYANIIYVRKGIDIVSKGVLFNGDTQGHEVGLAIHATLQVNGSSVTVCAIHGQPYPGDKLDSHARLYQSQVLLETFNGKESVIIGGDFNLLPQTDSIRVFSKSGYRDLIEEYAIKTTRNHITFEQYPDDIQYYADYIFVTPDLTVTGFVVPTEIVSDHQPLELHISI
jgi:endonuclease/exonuclease/phosphatase family metal-dependent hydrolase